MKFQDPIQKTLQTIHKGEQPDLPDRKTEESLFQEAFEKIEKQRAFRERIQNVNVRTY